MRMNRNRNQIRRPSRIEGGEEEGPLSASSDRKLMTKPKLVILAFRDFESLSVIRERRRRPPTTPPPPAAVILAANAPSFHRDPKSCLERWKNYLKPGIKNAPLTADEQSLLLRLRSVHGNNWKLIAAHLPGRSPKRLGKWWEVFKEKKQREEQQSRGIKGDFDPSKYDRILDNFAEKLSTMLPPWLSPTPSVNLTLSSGPQPPAAQWAGPADVGLLMEYCKEMEELQRAWAAERKEAAWRAKRVEMQMEAERERRRKEKMDEFEAKVRALREEERAALERIEREFREEVAALRRDAGAREERMAENLAARHERMRMVVERVGSCQQMPWVQPPATASGGNGGV